MVSKTTAHRLLSGGIFALLICTGLFYNPLQFFVPVLISIASAVGVWEFFAIAAKKDFKAQAVFGIVVTLLAIAEGYHFGMQYFFVVAAVAFVGCLALQMLRGGVDHFVGSASVSFFGCFYFGLPMGMAMALLHGPVGWVGGEQVLLEKMQGGRFLIPFLILVTWSSDIGAYFVGRKWGKRKLIPSISPGKTLEGMWGGLVGTIFTAVVLMVVWKQVRDQLFWGEAIALAIVFFFIGLVGDLAESAMKRDAGVKDSGSKLTGHGGIMDAMDSILVTTPIFFVHMKYLHPLLHPELYLQQRTVKPDAAAWLWDGAAEFGGAVVSAVAGIFV